MSDIEPSSPTYLAEQIFDLIMDKGGRIFEIDIPGIAALIRERDRAVRADERERWAERCIDRGVWADKQIKGDPTSIEAQSWASYSNGCDDCASDIRDESEERTSRT